MPDHPRPAAAALWGDGFSGDGLRDLWAVRHWDGCAPDEYILLFPRLVGRAGVLPPVLRARLEACVAVRAWRLGRLEGSGPPLLRSRPRPLDEPARHHGDWFADDGAVTCLLRRLGLLRTAPERLAAERATLAGLDALLADLDAGRVPGFDEERAALLAFGAGIHPAYLWPEAAAAPARGVVAGWLGHLDRGRTALMPMMVAEYVLEVLGTGGADPRLLALAGGTANLATLTRAARRRVAGHDPAVRLAPEATTLVDVFATRTRRALALGLET